VSTDKEGMLREKLALLRELEAERTDFVFRLQELDGKREALRREISGIRNEPSVSRPPDGLAELPLFKEDRPVVTADSPEADKIDLFLDLFRGRDEVFAVRWEGANGRKGFSFACANLWQAGCAKKDGGKCEGCQARKYIPFDGSVVRGHLRGTQSPKANGKEFAVGAYALLPDETCRFVVADFDKAEYRKDAEAFRAECGKAGIPVYLELSRSGNGCHAWVFFENPVSAHHARRMMLATMTKAMENRPELGFDSYDRLIPNQDRMSKGGLGSLIGLPLQQRPREAGNSLFVDENWKPFPDQWAFLSAVARMRPSNVVELSNAGAGSGTVFGIQMLHEDNADEPWKMKPSRPITLPQSLGLSGRTIAMRLADQLYVEREGLPSAAVTQFARIGAFQNREFYSAQAMGFWTGDIPRVISAAELFPNHVSLPRGCVDDARELARQYGAEVDFLDMRQEGMPLPEGVAFKGTLKPRQQLAFDRLMAHDIGVLKAPPSFGKTVVSIATIAARGRNTLIICFTSTVFKQWRERLKTFLDIDPGLIGWIGGGQMNATGVVDVALIQSLTRQSTAAEHARVLQYVSDIVGDYGHVVVDEVHHIAAKTFEPVVRRAKAKFFLGASATPKRKDGRHPLIFMHFGPVRYQVEPRQMIAESGIAHVYRQRNTSIRLPVDLAEAVRSGDAAPQEVYRALAEDEDRNYMIFDDVLRAMDRGRCPVVLTTRKDHLDNLYERFKPHVRNVVLLKGAMKAAERREAETLMAKPAGEERLILATAQFLGEGFDDPRLDALFMTMPTIWGGTLEQYAGRLQRQYEGKGSVEVIDYVDDDESFSRKAEQRGKVFRKLGFSIDKPDSSAPYMDD